MIVRKTLPEENAAVNALFAVAFETAPDSGPAQGDDTGVCHWGAFSEEGELMSSLSVTSFSLRFDGAACPMAGVGAVQTLPPYRRRGGVAACFAKALPAMYAEGFVFSYLFPFSTVFYRQFGYESCVRELRCTLDLSLLKAAPDGSSFRLATKEAPLTDAVRAVDRVWERRWNMEVLRGEADYDWLKKIDPLAKQEYLYVCFGPSGEALGYAFFRTEKEKEGRDLVCSRFRFTDAAGFRALLGVFKSLSADHRFAVFTLPDDPALPYLLGEWSLGAARFELQPGGMVRVVNVREALLRAAYRGDGELRLKLRDGQVEENNAVFLVRFENGRALSVERTDEAPDAVMAISSFSALIAGVCDFGGAKDWMGGIEVLNAEAPFERVFYRKSMMISEYF